MSCKKRQPVDWDNRMLVPLFHTRLILSHIVPDSLQFADDEGRLHFRYAETFTSTGLSDIADIPDTSIRKLFTIPFGQIFLSGGNNFLNSLEETSFPLEPVELSSVKISGGSLFFNIVNKIHAPITVLYQMPGTLKNGNMVSYETIVPAATSSGPGRKKGEILLEGYTADLTGLGGLKRNAFVSQILAGIAPDFPGTVSVLNTDSVIIDVSLRSLKASFAEGYFGQLKDTLNERTRIQVFDELESGNFALDDAQVKLEIENGLGAETRFSLLEVKSLKDGILSYQLQSAQVGQVYNMNRAIRYPFTPNYLKLIFNKSNSNILDILHQQPDEFQFKAAVELNPFGNISQGHDFADVSTAVKALLEVDIPLKFSASNLLFHDTIYLSEDSLPEYNTVRSGKLLLKVDNMFPFITDLQLYLLDEQLGIEQILLPEHPVSAGVPESDGRVRRYATTMIECEVDPVLLKKLLQKRKILLSAKFNTPEPPTLYQLYDTYDLRASLTARLIYNLQIK